MSANQTDPPEAPDPSASIVQAAEERLSEVLDRRPFSAQGFGVLEASIAEYIRSLVLESSKTARRQGSDAVSATDVDQAARYLFRGPTRSVMQHVGTVGGVLLGAAMSNGLAVISSDDPEALGIAVTIALAIIGTFMIAVHIARDIR